ncbi:tetratricopeptide repeat protein [Candidatus Woesearchaeota archaeon]|nr:tetratricopeptide repeat protein [Candidatus Woesearchaeota archaeon]
MNNMLISALLKKDDPLISENLKSIIDKEERYASFLYAIEESVTYEYLQNNKIKDKEIIGHLKFLLKNINSSIDLFNSDFEKHLYNNIIEALNEKSVTLHELKLCINYILWSIDNRKWLNDSQAYVKWLAHSIGLMEPNESKAYETKVTLLCKRQGIPQKQIDAMLKNDFSDIEIPDKDNVDIESVYYALDDDKKLDFVVEHFQKAPFLGEYYFEELLENKDYDAAEKLCKSILEMMPDFPPIESLLGIVYKEKGNKVLAKLQFEKTLRLLGEIPPHILPEKEVLIKETKKLLKEVSG